MKLRQDFVTNSSSTSFIISLRKKWNEENFMKAIGIEGNSPMNVLFENLFEAIEHSKRDIYQAMTENSKGYQSIADFLDGCGFDEQTIQIVEKILAEKRTVYYGELDSAGLSSAEGYFCMESFVVCDDDIYFNGSIGGW